ncbi:hypothetical protein EPUL_000941, partial [Erysiphe pulchra]
MAAHLLRREPWNTHATRLTRNWVFTRPDSARFRGFGLEKNVFSLREYSDDRIQSKVTNSKNKRQNDLSQTSQIDFSSDAPFAFASFGVEESQRPEINYDPSEISSLATTKEESEEALKDSKNRDIDEELGELERDSTPRPPRAVQAAYLRPLRRQATFNIPVCDLQLRSYSVQNLQFMADFALRAAYFLDLPASGPVPLPQITERWTVPKAHFIHKKIQENFERKTLRRLIQIKDGDSEVVRLWLGFLRKHAYYGVGMKANVYEFASLNVIKDMDAAVEQNRPEIEPLLGQYVFKEGSQFGEKIIEVANKENRWQASGGSAPMINTPDWQEISNKGPDVWPILPRKYKFTKFLTKFSRCISQTSSLRTSIPQTERIVFSAIQPTGIPHLGNYLGAMINWVKLQESENCDTKFIFSVADLHAREFVADILVQKSMEEITMDRWDPENRPGVANLLTILSAFDMLGRTPIELAESMQGMNLRELKNLLSQNVDEKLLPIREQYNKLIADHDHLYKVAARGLEKAYVNGHQNMRLERYPCQTNRNRLQ